MANMINETTTISRPVSKTKFWLKLIGGAILLHIILIALSILEVAIYSYLVAPGKDEAFYNAHAQVSGPWISGICGSLIIFLLVRNFIRKNTGRHLTYTIAFPLAYIALDILMFLPFDIDWTEHFPPFLMANGAKIAAAFLGYVRSKNHKMIPHDTHL
jgi:hypothetical protein